MPNENKDKVAGRADYAPDWITKSIDRVPPSNEELAPNTMADAILGIKPSGNSDGESGHVEPPRENETVSGQSGSA